ncbi:hypothetical protein SNE40_006137 [Patella caerulea]|uniref:UPF0547 domain-containing protein n=1 Tax=Patella caerulea TaxID=87958 RepID=A0AAN8K8Z7_PATCE
MGRRKFDRTVVKKCPICGQQIPVACRYCSCGHQFTTRVRTSSSTSSLPDERECDQGSNESSEGKRRRTVRTKRVRPDFFNSLDLEYSSRQLKPKKSKEEEESPKKKRGRPKGSVNKAKTSEPTTPVAENSKPVEEDVFSGVSQDKLNTYNIILSELNRKIFSQTFKPD